MQFKILYFAANACICMINYQSANQLEIEEFKTPFHLKLDATNRWVQLSSLMPWDELVGHYCRCFNSNRGRPSVNPRHIIGALIIKHKQNLSDRDTLSAIQENPYMQFFCGVQEFQTEPLFSDTLFVEARKRMPLEMWDEFNKKIMKVAGIADSNNNNKDENSGKVKIDASVCDQYIKYPTDIGLIDHARRWSEALIDEIYAKGPFKVGEKPRNYRKQAHEHYLAIAKKKKKSNKAIRKAIRKQLGYLRRNIANIDEMLDRVEKECGFFPLSRVNQRYLWVIRTLYDQQHYMYKNKTKRCDHRIVSLEQPHVRPIVRGKDKAPVEFGSKISFALSGGFFRIDRLSWEAYNEAVDLPTQVEAYKEIHGHYPELVQADRIYTTQNNRQYLKERGIRITAPDLGRPSKEEKKTPYEKKKAKQESRERNAIEGKIGEGKQQYNMNKIRAKLPKTSESWIGATTFVMNLWQALRLVGGG